LTGRLHELKETTADAASIIKELRQPEVQKSLENIKAISSSAKEIAAIFKDPQFAKNVENLNLAAERLKEATVAIQNTVAELNKAGTLRELNMTIKSVRNIMDSLASTESQGGMIGSITHLVLAVKQLLDETQKLRNAPVAPSNSPALPQSQRSFRFTPQGVPSYLL